MAICYTPFRPCGSSAAWRQAMEANVFGHLAELKGVIRSADYVKPYTVFNIKKNKYRLIAQVSYGIETVRVVGILTHAEYDAGRWKRGL
ncbi:MAG: type II toxin-antitoxin system HigB family toxin [Elusimicrobiota bacterium]